MSLKQALQSDIVQSMKSKDSRRLGVLRMLMAAVKQSEIDLRVDLDEQAILKILMKELKTRQDSYEQYSAASREDLAEQEAFEMSIIRNYLPEPLSSTELKTIVIDCVAGDNQKKMGEVIQQVKEKTLGRANPSDIARLVKEVLSSTP